MSSLLTALEPINFLSMLWFFLFVFVLHELEEWNINQFEHQHFEGLPPAATDRSARMWIAFVSLAGLLWCIAAIAPGNPTMGAWVILPAIAIMVQNAIQHIVWSIHFRKYAPGTISAALLLIPSGSYVVARALQQGYIPIWYTALWAAFICAGFIQTVRAGNKMTPFIRGINNLGIWLSNRIG